MRGKLMFLASVIFFVVLSLSVVALPVTVQNGFNLVSMPVEDSRGTLTIHGFILDLNVGITQSGGGDCNFAYNWIGNGWWIHSAPLGTLPMWDMDSTTGVFLYCRWINQPSITVDFPGTPYTTPITYDLYSGKDIITMPLTGYTASSYAAIAQSQGVDIDFMYKYNTGPSSYQIFVSSIGIGDFDLVPGEAYWVMSEEGGTFTVS